MSEFVVGQKVKYINSSYFNCSPLENGRIYTLSGLKEHYGITLKEIPLFWFEKQWFQTIIQSIDDVVVGMELTLKEPIFTQYSGFVVFGKVIVSSVNSNKIFIKLRNCSFVQRVDIKEFKEYKPKEENMCVFILPELEEEYEVVKPFTIVGLWNAFKDEHSCPEFQEKWRKLLSWIAGVDFHKTKWEDMEDIVKIPIMKKNLHHLEKKGLIRKKEKAVILKNQMILRDEFGYFWRVLSIHKPFMSQVLCVKIGENENFCIEKNGIIYSNDGEPVYFETVKDIERELDVKFEVV